MPRPLAETMDPGWAAALEPVAGQISAMGDFLRAEVADGRTYLPAGAHVLRAFQAPMSQVKVLIVGQDPYPTPGHAIGLSFAVDRTVRPVPRSLANIYRELRSDLGVVPPPHGDLTSWTESGVLLLNRVLTVAPGAPASHKGKGWETVTGQAITALVARGTPLVAILWGKDAQTLVPMLGDVPYVRIDAPVADVGRPRVLRLQTVLHCERPARRAGRRAGGLDSAMNPGTGRTGAGGHPPGALDSVRGDEHRAGEAIRTVPTATHWGTYLARTTGSRLLGLDPHPDDPHPTAIGDSVTDALTSAGRLTVPMIRRGWLENGPGPADRPGSRRRGADSYVPVDWATATTLVAGEIDRVRTVHGNKAIFGGSYGWGSAGRFHHPQSQVHRFLNMAGGYTRSVDTYSSAAITVLLRRVAGGWQTAMDSSPTFEEIAEYGSLVVAFGGLALRNVQVNDGGLGAHTSPASQHRARAAGVDFFSVSPLRTDAAEFLHSTWLPARPGTDVAVMLGLAHCIVAAGLHDVDFLDRCTTGWPAFEAYLLGRTDGTPKDATWAAGICGLPAATITELARRIATERTVISTSYSVQRADHGEQAPWMALTLAALSGSMGRPGGGFGCGLGALHRNGMRLAKVPIASFPQGVNNVADFIPVARISDLLTKPGVEFDYDGGRYVYPDIRLVYWVGGNPFHHHQDLNRLVDAWQRPDTVIVHEHFANGLARHADIVLPAATFAERNDFAAGREDPYLMAMVRAADPPGQVLTDYEIFSAIAEQLGLAAKFTEGRSADEWVRELYERTRKRAATLDVQLPDWPELVELGRVSLPDLDRPAKPYSALRADPVAHPIDTPSGRLEIFSSTIAGFGYPDCPPHPTWLEPSEWLGSVAVQRLPLALVSGQPERRLHSQFDNGAHSRAGKIVGREPVLVNPDDAGERGIAAGDVVRLFNERGACLAGAVLSSDIRPGVVRLSTGAWYDPLTPGGLDVHGNPNVLTADHGTSALAQGPSAHTCLVELELWTGPIPEITVFGPMPT